jgi:hypothetical protein
METLPNVIQGFSAHSVFFYSHFLINDPAGQLGANGDTAAIRGHPFFRTIDWEAFIEKCVEPPFKQLIEEVSVNSFCIHFFS